MYIEGWLCIDCIRKSGLSGMCRHGYRSLNFVNTNPCFFLILNLGTWRIWRKGDIVSNSQSFVTLIGWLLLSVDCFIEFSEINILWNSNLLFFKLSIRAFLISAYPIYLPTKFTFFISTNIKWASPTCFCIEVPWAVAASSLTSMICRRHHCTYFKAYCCAVFKNISFRGIRCIHSRNC